MFPSAVPPAEDRAPIPSRPEQAAPSTMRIERLEIVGFKSFAEPVTIEFHGGATAIVGPNGCGKSNLVDAVAWVLGELGARTIRARGRDLLFSGSADRSPHQVAEVRLAVSGVAWDGMRSGAAGPGAPGELVVSRRMDADAHSVYSIGGRVTTRREVRRLFAGTGLGAGSYALIEQGRTNQVLNARPEDLRLLIEEAAGLGAYRLNRRESEGNLRSTERSLEQVRTRLAELDRHLRRVRREAAAAGRMRQASERFDLLGLTLQAKRREELLLELGEGRPRASAFEEEQARRTRSLAAFERFFGHLRGKLEALDTELREVTGRAGRARERAARSEAILGEGARAAKARARRREALEREERDLRVRVRQREREQAARDQRVREFEPALAALRSRLEQAAAARDAARQSESAASGAVAATRSEVARLREVRRAAERSEKQERDRAARLADAAARVERTREDLEARNERAAREEARAAGRSEQRETDLAGRRAARRGLGAAKRTADEARDAARSDFRKASRSLDRIRARLAAARARARSGKHLGRGADTLMRVGRERGLPVHGPVGEAVAPDPGYERAAERLFRVHRVRVERTRDVTRIVEEMAGTASGPCELLVTELVQASGVRTPVAASAPPPAAEPAFDRIRVSDPAVWNARGEAFLAPDIETALSCYLARPASYVTRAGVLVTPPGVVRFGDGGAGEGYLMTRRDVEDLEAAEGTAARRRQAAATALEHAEGRARRAAAALDAGEKALREAAIEAARAALALERAESAVCDIERRLEEAGAEAERIGEALRESEAEARRAARELARSRAERLAEQGRLGRREAALAAAREKAAATARAWRGLDRERARLEAVADEVRRQARAWEREAERDAARPARIASEREGLAGEEARWQARRGTEVAERAAATAAAAEWEAAERRLLEARRTLDGRLETSRKTLRLRRAELAAVGDRLGELTAAASRARGRLEDLEGAFRRRSGRVLAEAAAALPAELLRQPQEWLEAERSRLAGRMDRIGPVNATAEDGVAALETERGQLASRLEDVERAMADGLKALERQDREAGRIFRDCHAVLHAGFDEAFRQLFGGGSAELRLAREPDGEEPAPLRLGLEIAARPPGKRLQSVRLLSGGEKAMTAIAFLIALFRYRPAPFCLLDEVDAPLDDANVRRFARLLRELRRSAQLVVITHNRLTMDACEHLYGVTMEEPGVSRVVSLRLSAVGETG